MSALGLFITHYNISSIKKDYPLMDLSGILSCVSFNKYLFSCIKSLTASFQALFIGSASNLSRAIDLNFCKSSLNTVADVLVSFCSGSNNGLVGSAITSQSIFPPSVISFILIYYFLSIFKSISKLFFYTKNTIFIYYKILSNSRTQKTQNFFSVHFLGIFVF